MSLSAAGDRQLANLAQRWGLVSETQLRACLEAQRASPRYVAVTDLLVHRGLVSKESMERLRAQQLAAEAPRLAPAPPNSARYGPAAMFGTFFQGWLVVSDTEQFYFAVESDN